MTRRRRAMAICVRMGLTHGEGDGVAAMMTL